jgi:hypothetical protein
MHEYAAALNLNSKNKWLDHAKTDVDIPHIPFSRKKYKD